MKKFYNKHRVFIILMGIVLICFVIILFLLMKYFYFGNSGKAPKRTCKNINEMRQGEIKSDLEIEAIVNNVKMRISDKSDIIFISILFNGDVTLIDAKSKAVGIFDKFSDEEKNCYDFEFVITSSGNEANDGFHLMGAKNKNGTNIYWNNNRRIEKEDN